MYATQILMNEHRVIEQVLACLEMMAHRAKAEGTLNTEAAGQALDFFEHFADGCHHAKEEKHLFPAVEAHGLSRFGGPTGVMLHEHEQGRRHIRALRLLVIGAAAGDRAAIGQFAQHALAYVYLLRDHIWKEDQRLFPLADRILSAGDQEQLVQSFHNVEDHEIDSGAHEKYLRIADDLALRFGVTRATQSSAPALGGVCCSHAR